MKRIGTLGYVILGLITTSAFAQTTPSPETAAPSTENASANPTKGKKGGKKHSHSAHKKHGKKKPAAEQK